MTPLVREKNLLEFFLPVAALALELSGPDWLIGEGEKARAERIVKETLSDVTESAALTTLPCGVLIALYTGTTLHEAAVNAARAATKIQAYGGKGNLEVRVGLAHGIVDGEKAWTSSVVCLAVRQAWAAQPGQIVATMGLSKELERGWDFMPVGVLPRRKEDWLDRAVVLEGPKAPASTPSALASDDGAELIGREAELRALSAELKRAVTGRGTRWCAVVAPAGGGKSKLLRSWLRGLRNRDVAVVGASASPFGGQPLSPIAGLCGALEADLPLDASPTNASKLLAAALAKATRQKPVVLLFDDLHWADEPSLRTLKLFAESGPFEGCLVVVALRAFFLDSISWLKERARIIRLPGLNANEKELLVRRLLPERLYSQLGERLAQSPLAGNPLYLEQCAAYLCESGNRSHLPQSLHEAILKRLQLLLRSLDGHGFSRPSAGEIAAVERKVCEWLDRLETGDYEGRAAIAEYLGLLQNIDSSLFTPKAIIGLPQLRNRRLAEIIDRFYSASFAERSEAIESLARRDRANAAYAAEAGASRAFEGFRIKDAVGYLQSAARYSKGDQRHRNLIELGDSYFVAGLYEDAWRAYEAACRDAANNQGLEARCEQRLGRTAMTLGRSQQAEKFLRRALPHLEGRERFIASCDLIFVLAVLQDMESAKRELERLQEQLNAAEGVQSAAMLHLMNKTKLRVAMIGGDDSTLTQLASECANTWVFDTCELSELTEFLDTVSLLQKAAPASIAAALRSEADRIAVRIGKKEIDRGARKPLDKLDLRQVS